MGKTQTDLLDLFEQQFAHAFGAGDPTIQNPKAATRTEIQNEENPFQKQWGACRIKHEGRADGRLYWCHRCGKKFCWECFTEHSD